MKKIQSNSLSLLSYQLMGERGFLSHLKQFEAYLVTRLLCCASGLEPLVDLKCFMLKTLPKEPGFQFIKQTTLKTYCGQTIACLIDTYKLIAHLNHIKSDETIDFLTAV